MAIRATEGLTPSWWTPPSEKDEDRPTRFLIAPLTGAQQDEVLEGATIEDGRLMLTAAGIRRAIRYGLRDWENFDGEHGPIPFSHAATDKLPWSVRRLLAGEIVNRSDLTGDEVKNS